MKFSCVRHRNPSFVKTSRGGLYWFVLTTMSLLLSSLSWSAQREPNVPPPEATQVPGNTPTVAHEMTAADLEAFLEGLMPLQLERDDIAGAVVAVVKDGKLLFAKGYGFADVANKKPVSADSTLFRPGSVSKLFTWTAVMQLVEQGKLDLDRDVNEYLDFKIPATYSQPITLRNIMTHRAGFGETLKDLFVNDTHDLQPLGAYLRSHMPKRIFAPGAVPAYSNYATTVAGYVVERVSGKSFNDYVNDNIFKPLNMHKTTFAQPLPDNLKPLMSNGYRVASGRAKPFEVVQAWPAGSVSTSATDMAAFMIAHLQKGEFQGARILRQKTAELMHSRQFSPNPALNGMALGFYEETRNGRRIIGHGGDTICFHTDLHLMLNDGVGFFVSYNSPGKGTISNRAALWHKFLDRYFPYAVDTPPQLSTADGDAREVAGQYLTSRRPAGNLFAGLSMLSQVRIQANSDGTIAASSSKDLNGELKKFREIQPLVYQDVKGQDRIAFQRDAGGRLYFAADFPVFVFQRAGFLQIRSLNLFLLSASGAVFVLVVVFWPITALVRRHYRKKLTLTRRERRLRVTVRLVCVLDLLFLVGLMMLLGSLENTLPTSHITGQIHFLQAIGLIGAVGTVIAVYNAWQVWRPARSPVLAKAIAAVAATAATESTTAPTTPVSQSRWWWSRVSETLVALACLAFTWFVVYWNLLNFSSNF